MLADIYADLYIRLSDATREEQFDGREARLRAEAARLGWHVHDVIEENDITTGADGTVRIRPASAFKRVKIPGRKELRVNRPGFRRLIADLESGAVTAVLAEDLDRACRDPRDLEDLIDACHDGGRRASARSLSGSLTLTDGGTDAEITMARMMVTMANKSSRDTARRVADSWERRAGQSYCGGRRAFGYRYDPDAEAYHKTLIVVPAEAAVIRQAAADILDRGISLRAIAKDLRDRGIVSAFGLTSWRSSAVKSMLTKPSVAGLVFTGGVERKAPWPAILDRDTWERLCVKLNDPARLSAPGRVPGTANEPRWLVSVFARCGICRGQLNVTAAGGRGRPRVRMYSGADCRHVARDALRVDAHIADLVVARLDKPDIKHGGLLKPPPRRGVGVKQLRAELDKLRRQRKALLGTFEGDADALAVIRGKEQRIAVIDARLAAAASKPDPVPEFRGDVLAVQVWDGLTVARRRAVVQALITSITINPARRGSHTFDPSTITVVPAADVPWPELSAA